MSGLNLNIPLSNALPVVGVIDPDAYTANTYTTGWISMADFKALLAIVMVGDITTNGTVDAKLEQALNSSGGSAKDISDKAITQLTQAGSDSNKIAVIEVWEDELDKNNDFDYVRLSVTTATAASDMAGVVLGLNARYQPAADLAAVDEIVGRA